MRAVGAFSPGHITGFVEFPITDDDPLLKGSRGAGICISRGVRTMVHAEPSGRNRVSILMNGVYADDAEVSRYVVEEYLRIAKGSFSIKVDHELEIPVGYGLGSSGAAALSLSLALDKALETGLSDVEAAQIAHKADLTCKCGLGTVLAEYHGGFEMRLDPGAPGIGVVHTIPLDRKVVILCISPVSTKEFLTSKMTLINGLGGKMLSKLAKTRSVDDFMDMSLQFARSIGFVSERCKRIINEMNSNGFKCSTAMFGETIFSVVRDEEVNGVKKIFSKYDGELLVSDIYARGARMLC
jgi:pantoate kinase